MRSWARPIPSRQRVGSHGAPAAGAVLLDILLRGWIGARPAVASPRTDRGSVVATSSRSAEDFGVALDDVPARSFIPKSAFSAKVHALSQTS